MFEKKFHEYYNNLLKLNPVKSDEELKRIVLESNEETNKIYLSIIKENMNSIKTIKLKTIEACAI